MVEKHIALKNQKKGLDIEFSIRGPEIKKFKEDIITAKKLLGSKSFKRDKSENASKIFRRSIIIVGDIKKGERFSKKNIKVLRPNIGIQPKYLNNILGKKSQFNFKKGNPLPVKVLKSLKIKK